MNIHQLRPLARVHAKLREQLVLAYGLDGDDEALRDTAAGESNFPDECAAGLSNADLALMICNSDGVADHSIIVIREARADETVAPDITYDVALEIVPICDRFADEGRQIQACAAGLLRQFKLRNAIEDRDTAKYLNQREYA